MRLYNIMRGNWCRVYVRVLRAVTPMDKAIPPPKVVAQSIPIDDELEKICADMASFSNVLRSPLFATTERSQEKETRLRVRKPDRLPPVQYSLQVVFDISIRPHYRDVV